MIRTAFTSLALGGAVVGAAWSEEDAALPASPPIDEISQDQDFSQAAIEIAGWIIATRDNGAFPFAVIDKSAAQILVFGPDGALRGAAPGLFGSAVGDHTLPGVADLPLSQIPAEDRTTPAGRYVGGFGPAAGGKKVLWVDYASAVAIHAVATGNPAEKRAERLASPSPDDNRITHGCINVSTDFFEKVVGPVFTAGGLFYILPDAAPLSETFPRFALTGGGR